MDAKKCDRCGVFYQPEDWKDGDVVIGKKEKVFTSIICNEFYFKNVDMDLCPGCRSFIKDWLTKKEVNNEKAN